MGDCVMLCKGTVTPDSLLPDMKAMLKYEENGCKITGDVILAMISIAQSRGSGSTVLLPPGTHYIDKRIDISDARELTIDGQGCTLVFTAMDAAFRISRSSSVEIRNLTIDYDPLPFTQGVIKAIGEEGRWYDVELDQGYQAIDTSSWQSGHIHLVIVDPENSTPNKPNGLTMTGCKSVEWVDNAVLRVHTGRPTLVRGCANSVGDLAIVLHRNHGKHAFDLHDTDRCCLSNVTVHSSPAVGILERHGRGGNRYSHVAITPGPPPRGATSRRLLSTNMDSFHSVCLRKGPIIENCIFEYMGDDGINVRGKYGIVADQVARNSLVVSCIMSDGCPQVSMGDSIQFLDGKTLAVTGHSKVASISRYIDADLSERIKALVRQTSVVAMETTTFTPYRIDLEDDVHVEPGSLFISLDRIGSGVVVRDSAFCFNRGTGIRLGCSDVTVVNNRLEGNSACAVALSSHPDYWGDGHHVTDAVVRGNLVKDVGLAYDSRFSLRHTLGAISVTVMTTMRGPGFVPSRENSRITIEDNTVDNTAISGLFITNAQDVKVNNNRFVNTNCLEPFQAGESLGIDVSSAIYVAASARVTFRDNVVESLGEYAKSAVKVHESADVDTIDISGIRFTDKQI